jgi:hypothetical protein
MGDVLTKAAESRKMALSLKNVEYGGELLQQMMTCSAKLEKIHENLNELIAHSGEGENESKFQKLIGASDAQCQWFDKAKDWC